MGNHRVLLGLEVWFFAAIIGMMLVTRRFSSAKAVFLMVITTVSILLPLTQTAALAYLDIGRQELV